MIPLTIVAVRKIAIARDPRVRMALPQSTLNGSHTNDQLNPHELWRHGGAEQPAGDPVGLLTTQNRVSSGLRVATAKDDAADWVTATTMKSNIPA